MRSVFHWQNDAFQWFDFQTHGFTYQGRNASWQCSATLRKAKKKITTRGLFISAMSRVKLIAQTRVYVCHKNMKSMGSFLQFFESFRGKYKLKNILQEMKNGLSLRQQQLQVIMYYIITWAFHKLSCRQNECTYSEKTNSTFIFL